MKKILSMLLALMMLTGLFAITASAEEDAALTPEEKIERLVLSGFADMPADLAAPVSRLEAAVCVVLMLGDEDTALAADDVTVPFTDVSAEFAPYIAYLYNNGYTNGVSATLFGSDLNASFAQFYTFVLRALGYVEGEDFTYATVLDDARELAILDEHVLLKIAAGETFTVADLMIAVYDGLDALICGEEYSLIDVLFDEDLVSETAYELFYGANELYNYLTAVGSTQPTSMTMNATCDFTQSSLDEDLGGGTMDMDVYLVTGEDGIPAVMMDMTMSVEGADDQVISVYYDASGFYFGIADQWMYYADMIAVGGEEADAIAGSFDVAAITAMMQNPQALMGGFDMLGFIEGLTLDLVDDNAVISGVIDMSWTAALYESMLGDDYMIDIEPIVFEMVVDGETQLPVAMSMDMLMSISVQGVPLDVGMTMDAEFSDYGATEITIPDGLALLLDAPVPAA